MRAIQHYKTLRADVDAPEKAAVAYRDFVKEAVRSSVLDHKAFDPDAVMAMAEARNIPDEDRGEVVAYVGAQFKGLHEGNVIRYRLKPEDLAGIRKLP